MLISSLLLLVWNSRHEYWRSSVVGHDQLSTGPEKVIAYCLLSCIAFRSQWIRNFLLTQWWYRNPLLITLLLTYYLTQSHQISLGRHRCLGPSIFIVIQHLTQLASQCGWVPTAWVTPPALVKKNGRESLPFFLTKAGGVTHVVMDLMWCCDTTIVLVAF